MRRFIAALGAVLAAAFCAPADDAATPPLDDAILVLDGSGTMWGRVDGAPKIEIARRTITGLLNALPAERRLGLMAYGQARENDCADVELLAPVDTGRDAVRAALSTMAPKGRTALSTALREAAEALDHTQTKATVIVVTDGADTCVADPCKTAAELERSGLDFTAHVIGFDVQEQARREQLFCLADRTGGSFMLADTPLELAEALSDAVSAPDPRPATLTLSATELEDGPLINERVTWRVRKAGGGEVVFEDAGRGMVEVEASAGVYDIIAERDGQRAITRWQQARPGASRFITVAFDIELEASLRLEPPDAAPAGGEITVHWEGPERDGDFLVIAAPGDEAPPTQRYSYVRSGNPITLRMPVEPGAYEARYMLGDPQRVLARAPITATPVEATIAGPPSVFANVRFDVAWTGPSGDGDIITIVPAGAGERDSGDYAYARDTSTVRLRAPLSAGAYELRYLQAGQKVLARAPITVEGLTATLDGPAEAVAGARISVAWSGPGGQGDYITIVEPGADARANHDFGYARDAAPAEFDLPLEPGAYELRYVQAGREVLASAPITILPFEASLTGPEDVAAGERFTVSWTGPNYRGDFITIVAPEASAREGSDPYYARNGDPARLRAPGEPGAYELRYVVKGRHIAARTPISVVAE